MPFVSIQPGLPIHQGRCPALPNSKRGTAFGVGTIWQCDDIGCRKRWKFAGYHSDQRDSWDDWKEISEYAASRDFSGPDR